MFTLRIRMAAIIALPTFMERLGIMVATVGRIGRKISLMCCSRVLSWLGKSMGYRNIPGSQYRGGRISIYGTLDFVGVDRRRLQPKPNLIYKFITSLHQFGCFCTHCLFHRIHPCLIRPLRLLLVFPDYDSIFPWLRDADEAILWFRYCHFH